MAGSLAQLLEAAAEHAAAGRRAQALAAYERACQWAEEAGTKGDPLQRAVAALGFVHQALEDRSWPEILGKQPDELLTSALEAARGAKHRSRSLEGQLQFIRSKALFAKPMHGADCLEEAMNARFQATELLQEGAVETLPWSMKSARSLLEDSKAQGAALLGEDELLARLRVLGGGEGAEEEARGLFTQWASGDTDGPAITLTDFLERFLEVAARLNRKVDEEPCSAPCEGGLPDGASEMEKELVALVARDGAGKWAAKAAELRAKGLGKEVDGPKLESLWKDLAPKIQKVVAADEPMACGHSCSTCPTRDDCQVHTALKDIEDI